MDTARQASVDTTKCAQQYGSTDPLTGNPNIASASLPRRGGDFIVIFGNGLRVRDI